MKRSPTTVGGATARVLVSWARESPLTLVVFSVAIVGSSILTFSYWGWLGAVWIVLCVAYFIIRLYRAVLRQEATDSPPSCRKHGTGGCTSISSIPSASEKAGPGTTRG